MNAVAFAAALNVFNKTRANMPGCLRAAIEEYRREELFQLLSLAHSVGGLEFSALDTETGPATALVITGFQNEFEVERFVVEKLHAQGQ